MGPSTEPCGTPQDTGSQSETKPSITTDWVLPVKKERNHCRAKPLICKESLRIFSRMSCCTVSNADDKSINEILNQLLKLNHSN